MDNTILYWLGSAVALTGGMLLTAAILLAAGWVMLQAAVYMLRNGLHIIRLSNWRYWNDRMQKEGLIVMQQFYREQVAIHRPKSLQEFDAVDRSATAHEQEQRAKEVPNGN